MCRRALGFQGSAEKELLQETDLALQRVQFQKLAFPPESQPPLGKSIDLNKELSAQPRGVDACQMASLQGEEQLYLDCFAVRRHKFSCLEGIGDLGFCHPVPLVGASNCRSEGYMYSMRHSYIGRQIQTHFYRAKEMSIGVGWAMASGPSLALSTWGRLRAVQPRDRESPGSVVRLLLSDSCSTM